MKKHSAGLLVYRTKNGQTEVLLAHMGSPWWAKKDKGAWSIPKGEYLEDEDPLAAAKREFNEELGQPVPDGDLLELGLIEQNNNKTVIAWALPADLDVRHITSNKISIEWPPRSGKKMEYPEIDRAEYFPLAQAAAKMVTGQPQLLQRLADILGVPYNPDSEPKPPSQASLF